MNQALHEHVTSGVFTLTLTKNHIAMLEHLYLWQYRPWSEHMSGKYPRQIHRMWATAGGGLIARGLVRHHDTTRFKDKNLIGQSWEITRAGNLMIEVLKEAGLIDPELKPMRKLPKRSVS